MPNYSSLVYSTVLAGCIHGYPELNYQENMAGSILCKPKTACHNCHYPCSAITNSWPLCAQPRLLWLFSDLQTTFCTVPGLELADLPTTSCSYWISSRSQYSGTLFLFLNQLLNSDHQMTTWRTTRMVSRSSREWFQGIVDITSQAIQGALRSC